MKKKVNKLNELKYRLAEARYRQAGYFPHPSWAKEEKRILKEIELYENKQKKK